MFPAVQPAESAIRSLIDPEAKRITLTPDRSLKVGRFKFAVASQNLAFMADEKERAVDGTPRPTIKFNHPDNDIDARPARRSAQPIGGRTGYFDGIG